jgi:hypothetical protein
MCKLAGNIKMSNRIIPHAANFESKGIQSAMPKMISTKPLIQLICLGLEK